MANSKFEELLGEYRIILFAKKHYEQIKIRIANEKTRLNLLGTIVEKEYKDVLDLEKASLRFVFNKFLGQKKDRYEKEKQEYLHAVLQFKECKKMIDLLEYEKKVIGEKVIKEPFIEKQIEEWITKRGSEVLAKYPRLSKQILFLDKQMDASISRREELKIPFNIAKKGEKTIGKMVELLIAAKHSGSWGDSEWEQENKIKNKNSKIDQAQELSYKAKQLLQELKDDMEQLAGIQSIQLVKFETLDSFTDIYYNQLISDWVVHSKIVHSIEYLQTILNNLKEVNKAIETELENCKKQLSSFSDERSQLLLKYIKQL